MVFNWIDILLSLGIVQGVFLIFSLHRIKDRNIKLNRTLIVLLSITTYMLVGRLIYFQFPAGTFDRIALLFDTVIFLFGPITFNFVSQFLFSGEKYKLNWPLHLVPASIHLIISLALIVAGQDMYNELIRMGWMYPYYTATEVLAIALNLGYLFACFMLLRQYKLEEKKQLSFEQNPQRFVGLFLIGSAILILLWLMSVVRIQLRLNFLNFIRYDAVWSTIPFLTYIVGYYLQKQPALFRVKPSSNLKTDTNRLSEAKVAEMRKVLDALMMDKNVYLSNKITLSSMATMLDEKPNDLSWLLNEAYDTTFYDFINGYRVKEFSLRVENNQHNKMTILGIAMDCGFNSKSTFNKAFKKYTNYTPSSYIQKLESKMPL